MQLIHPNWKVGAPKTVGGNSVFLKMYFENVNEIFDRAQKAGIAVAMSLADALWGDRYDQVKNPNKCKIRIRFNIKTT